MAAETNDTAEERPRFEMPDGVEYELPNIRELNMDEWMLMYEYARIVLRDLMEASDPEEERAREEKLENPGVMMGLFHIGYKRKHPQKTDAVIKALVGKIQYLPTLQDMGGVELDEEGSEEEDPTPDSAPDSESSSSEARSSSERSADSSTESGSSDSSMSSETPEETLATTGTSG